MLLTFKINSYFATLIVTIFGAAAALLIIHVADSSTLAASFAGSSSQYASLQNSILNK